MWPWEHIAFGYLAYSLASRLLTSRPPTQLEALAVAFASLLPDLVDKPLAWGLGVLPGGRSLTHSLLVTSPLLVTGVVLGARFGRTRLAAAVVIGHLSHLAGDVIYPLVTDGELRVGFLLWPLVSPASSSGPPVGLLSRFLELVGEFAAFLGTSKGLWYLAIELAVLFVIALLWVADGAPGLPRPS